MDDTLLPLYYLSDTSIKLAKYQDICKLLSVSYSAIVSNALIPCLLFHLVKCNIKCYSCKTVSFIIWTSCCSIWYFDYSLLLCIDMLQWTYGFHSFLISVCCSESGGVCIHILFFTYWIFWSQCCSELGENIWCTYRSHRYSVTVFCFVSPLGA